jgi:hypothetical protein
VKKLIEERRRLYGDFEVVDWVDTQEIERLRAETELAVPLELRWNWDYASRIEDLRSLYEKGKLSQWNAELDLDWEIPCTRDEFVVGHQASVLALLTRMAGRDEATQKAAAFDEIAYLLSQLLHGEQAALQLCGQLTNACVEMDEKWYAASQVADEARHVEALAKFLQRKMGVVYPIGPTLKVLLEELLRAETVQKKTLGMQCLFEGMAVGIFDLLRRETHNDLLREMIRRVEQDEARHAAFGVLVMRRVLRDAEPEERAALEDWAFSVLEALNANQQLDMLRVLGSRYEIDPETVTRMGLAMPNFAEFNSLAYMHTVLPNLKRLGLLTERTREGYLRLGMLREGSLCAD